MIGADRRILNIGFRPFSSYWWRAVRRIPTRYIKHKYQRLTRGFSDADMWNGDGFIADVISATAYWHFSNGMGYPGRMTHEEWLDTLLEIYEGFRNPDDDVDWRPSDMAWDLLKENHADLWG